MPADEQHERLSKQLDAELGDLAREGERLEHQIDEVRSQWRAKQADPALPGAVSPDSSDDSQADEQPQADDEPPSADRRDQRSST